MKVEEYTVSEQAFEILNEAGNKSIEGLRESIRIFVLHGLGNALPSHMMASAVAQHVCGEALRAMCVLYGMSAADVEEHSDALDILIMRVQKQAVVAVAEFVRTHLDDAFLYVHPKDRKRNDSTEKCD